MKQTSDIFSVIPAVSDDKQPKNGVILEVADGKFKGVLFSLTNLKLGFFGKVTFDFAVYRDPDDVAAKNKPEFDKLIRGLVMKVFTESANANRV